MSWQKWSIPQPHGPNWKHVSAMEKFYERKLRITIFHLYSNENHLIIYFIFQINMKNENHLSKKYYDKIFSLDREHPLKIDFVLK
jgi:hypothetical protein